MLDAVVELARGRRSSPGAVAAFLGVAQWFDLLRRLRLSIFDHVYAFASGLKAKDRAVRDVPDPVVAELLLDLAPLLGSRVCQGKWCALFSLEVSALNLLMIGFLVAHLT